MGGTMNSGTHTRPSRFSWHSSGYRSTRARHEWRQQARQQRVSALFAQARTDRTDRTDLYTDDRAGINILSLFPRLFPGPSPPTQLSCIAAQRLRAPYVASREKREKRERRAKRPANQRASTWTYSHLPGASRTPGSDTTDTTTRRHCGGKPEHATHRLQPRNSRMIG